VSAGRRDVVTAAAVTLLLIGALTLFQVYTYAQIRFTQQELAQNVAERRKEHAAQNEAHRTTHDLLRRILEAIRAAPAERRHNSDTTPDEGGDL